MLAAQAAATREASTLPSKRLRKRSSARTCGRVHVYVHVHVGVGVRVGVRGVGMRAAAFVRSCSQRVLAAGVYTCGHCIVCVHRLGVACVSMCVSGWAGDCRATVVAAGVFGIVTAGTGTEVSIRSVREKHAAGTS